MTFAVGFWHLNWARDIQIGLVAFKVREKTLSMLQVQYMVRVLLDWFSRVRALLVAKTDGLSTDKVMSVTLFVSIR